MEEEKNMSFLDHLEELRWRLVRSSVAIVLFAVVIFIFREWLMENVFLTLKDTDFPTYALLCSWFGICVDEISLNVQNINMSGQFSLTLMISIVGGIVCAFPYIFWEMWGFVKPGLRQNEAQMVRGITFFVSVLFFLGILFGYYIIAPLTVQFFGNWKLSEDISNNITIASFLTTIVSTVFYTGLLFLLPVVIYVFSKLGIMTPSFLRKYRRHAIVIVLILAAIITPPDFISQIIVAVPILILYEVGILISARVEKNRTKL
ncbi:MAG: twin-arginine translocase subunit TatC [Crocinitomicaceae bacterium]